MALVVFGIPTCGTVKKARSWMVGRQLAHVFVDFRQNPPDRARVETWVRTFGAKALKNTSGASYRALGPEKDAWSEAQWTDAFARDPMLIKRPVLERDEVPVMVGFSEDQAKERL